MAGAATAAFPSYQHPETGEWAHDLDDPCAEALAAFVRPAWEARPPAPGRPLRILEAGFGRGLNTATALRLLAAEGWEGPVEALGLEPRPGLCAPWPPCPEDWKAWMPWWGRGPGAWSLAGRPQWRGSIRALSAAEAPRACEPGRRFDWIFLDLFSPARHPADWEPGLCAALSAVAAPGAVLTSYCCARVLRAGLAEQGWQAARLRVRGRRDSLRAVLSGCADFA